MPDSRGLAEFVPAPMVLTGGRGEQPLRPELISTVPKTNTLVPDFPALVRVPVAPASNHAVISGFRFRSCFPVNRRAVLCPTTRNYWPAGKAGSIRRIHSFPPLVHGRSPTFHPPGTDPTEAWTVGPLSSPTSREELDRRSRKGRSCTDKSRDVRTPTLPSLRAESGMRSSLRRV